MILTFFYLISVASDFIYLFNDIFFFKEEITNFGIPGSGVERIISILDKIMCSCVTYRSQSLSRGQPIGEGERDRHPVFFARSNRVWTLRNSPDFLNREYVALNADVCWLLYLSMNIQCVSVIKVNLCHLQM